MAAADWHALVVARARESGVGNLPTQTVAEFAAHLEDIYFDALSAGRSECDAISAAKEALQESPLSLVPTPRTRPPDARLWNAGAPEIGGGLHGLGGDGRFAWRQLRRSPSFAAVAILTIAVGAGAPPLPFSASSTLSFCARCRTATRSSS